jgi:hypothetical protein
MKTPGCRGDPDQQSNSRRRTKTLRAAFHRGINQILVSPAVRLVRRLASSGSSGQFPSRAPCIDAQVLCSTPERIGNDKHLLDGTFFIGFDLSKQR